MSRKFRTTKYKKDAIDDLTMMMMTIVAKKDDDGDLTFADLTIAVAFKPLT